MKAKPRKGAMPRAESIPPKQLLSKRTSGVLLHISSLPGPHGIGDFGPSAFHFVDWLANAKQSIWQWLPSTPIGPGNSPYQSVSAFAGSPLMVALEPLAERGWLSPSDLQHSASAQHFTNNQVNYARVQPWRIAQLRNAFDEFRRLGTPAQQLEFSAWKIQQRDWLDDYALFMALEAAYVGLFWWQWPNLLRTRDISALQNAHTEHALEISFWCFVQWCFDWQCGALKSYANSKNVALMGDLPIFVAHHSADCWARPDLYYLDQHYLPTVVAGVPPDAMAAQGQRWGNPLYRWDAMIKDDFAWWVSRVRRLLAQVDAFRIDHFRGFAAYWEIPQACPDATQGQWVTAPGEALFKALHARLGTLNIVAEDLGTITADVNALRQACGFPGMKILQFAFGKDGTHDYLPHNFDPHCVVYPGTHDNDTLHGWWQNLPAHEKSFVTTYAGINQESELHWDMIRTASNSVANTAIFAMQDILGLDGWHRMNTPGEPTGNWTWRFYWDMVGPEPAVKLGQLTQASGR